MPSLWDATSMDAYNQEGELSLLESLDALLAMGSGAAGDIFYSAAALGALPSGGIQGWQDTKDSLMENYTYQPRTEGAQQSLSKLGEKLQPVSDVTETGRNWLGDSLTNDSFSDEVNASLYALGNTLPELAGGLLGGRAFLNTTGRFADKYGLQRGLLGDINSGVNKLSSGTKAGRQRGTIGGRKSKTLNPKTVEMAEDMRDAGKSRDEIWAATGAAYGQPAYFDPVDGSFRYEIDDSGAKLNQQALLDFNDESALVRQGRLMEHNDLYDAYPDTQNIRYLKQNEAGASYNPSTDEISLPQDAGSPDMFPQLRDKLVKSPVLHEVQHAVQGREGFARGGNPEMFSPFDRTNDLTAPIYKRQMELLDQNPDFGEVQRKIHREFSEIEDAYGTLEETASGNGAVRLDWADVPQKTKDDYFALKDKSFNYPEAEEYNTLDFDRYNIQRADNILTPDQQYNNLLGEVDSRAVQKRMDMTMDERIAKPFWESYDVPEDEFIRQYRDGIMESSKNGDAIPEGLLDTKTYKKRQ